MALQGLAGLSWIGGAIATAAYSAFQFVGKYLAFRYSQFAAFVVILGLIYSAFWAAIWALIETFSAAAPDELVQAASMVVPDNGAICLAACITARLARYAFDMKTELSTILFQSS